MTDRRADRRAPCAVPGPSRERERESSGAQSAVGPRRWWSATRADGGRRRSVAPPPGSDRCRAIGAHCAAGAGAARESGRRLARVGAAAFRNAISESRGVRAREACPRRWRRRGLGTRCSRTVEQGGVPGRSPPMDAASLLRRWPHPWGLRPATFAPVGAHW
jgi:hypothetical protein